MFFSLPLAFLGVAGVLAAPMPLDSRGLVTGAKANTTAGGVAPLGPSSLDVFPAGGNCTTSWSPAPLDGKVPWNNMTISLMTGQNANMTTLATVASGIDGTNAWATKYTFECPDVQPYSQIYFLQFSNGYDPMASQWTTRFTIASPRGETTPPEFATQPTGEAVPWGNGRLVTDSKGDIPGATKASNASAQGTAAKSAFASIFATPSAAVKAKAAYTSGAEPRALLSAADMAMAAVAGAAVLL